MSIVPLSRYTQGNNISPHAFIEVPWLEDIRDDDGLVIINNAIISAKNVSDSFTIPNRLQIYKVDSDTLITSDLSELWNIDLKDNIIAGVADCIDVPDYRKRFFIDSYCC